MIWFLLIASSILSAQSTPDENLGVTDTSLFEGDMILTDAQKLAALMGRDVSFAGDARASINANLWPGAVMPYVIDPSLARNSRAMSVIRAGMKLWTDRTCITFKPRTSEAGYAYFYQGGGCSSMVGRTGSRQLISLASGCWHAGIVAHEIGHALGFYHEQSRPDRDSFVTINWNNIQSGMSYNFNKYPNSQINSLGTPYDYNSVMHYGATAFSINGQPTIVPKKAGVSIGNRQSPSQIDYRQMNLLYKCSGGGTPKPTTALPTAQSGTPLVTKPPKPTTVLPITPGTCVDKDNRCSMWSYYCKSNNYVKANCKKTCNLCGSSSCADKDNRCGYWPSYCRTNSYVKTNCRKTCNLC